MPRQNVYTIEKSLLKLTVFYLDIGQRLQRKFRNILEHDIVLSSQDFWTLVCSNDSEGRCGTTVQRMVWSHYNGLWLINGHVHGPVPERPRWEPLPRAQSLRRPRGAHRTLPRLFTDNFVFTQNNMLFNTIIKNFKYMTR
jgi:hypothetical protein